jgi:hypothetical protein
MSAIRNGCNVTDVRVQKYITNATFLLLSEQRNKLFNIPFIYHQVSDLKIPYTLMVGFLTIYFQYYDFPAISSTVIHFRFLGRRRNVAFVMYFCTLTSVTLHPFLIADILTFFLRHCISGYFRYLREDNEFVKIKTYRNTTIYNIDSLA